MLELDVNAVIWGIFVSATMKAAVHLAQDYQNNLSTNKSTDFEKIKQLFDASQKFILDQRREIHGISTIDWSTIPWMRAPLLNEQSRQAVKSKGTRFLRFGTLSWQKLMNIHDQ